MADNVIPFPGAEAEPDDAPPFSQADIQAITQPVSYTHLDVYKRQGEVGLVVEGVQAHGGVQAGLGGAEGGGAALAAGDLIGQDEFEERGVAQLLLAGQVEPFGQGVGHPAQFQGPQARRCPHWCSRPSRPRIASSPSC